MPHPRGDSRRQAPREGAVELRLVSLALIKRVLLPIRVNKAGSNLNRFIYLFIFFRILVKLFGIKHTLTADGGN